MARAHTHREAMRKKLTVPIYERVRTEKEWGVSIRRVQVGERDVTVALFLDIEALFDRVAYTATGNRSGESRAAGGAVLARVVSVDAVRRSAPTQQEASDAAANH